MKISRKMIVENLKEGLEKNSLVFAFWLEGSTARGNTDDFSDIDIWVDVKDGMESKIFKKIENLLSRISKIRFLAELESSIPGVRTRFYHFPKTSKFFLVDVSTKKHSYKYHFLRGEENEARVIFDKAGVIQFEPIDNRKFRNFMKKRIGYFEAILPVIQIWMEKQIRRQNYLEALSHYYSGILFILVEILRLKHNPIKRGNFLNKIYQQLPGKEVSKIEDLFKIHSLEELDLKSKKALFLIRREIRNFHV